MLKHLYACACGSRLHNVLWWHFAISKMMMMSNNRDVRLCPYKSGQLLSTSKL